MKFKINKKEKSLTFGAYPTLSISQARKLRDMARTELQNNIDPSAIKRKKAVEANNKDNLFITIYTEWLKRYTVKPKTRRITTNRIEKYVLPVIGNIPLNEITSQIIFSILEKIEKESSDKAHRIKSYISAIFQFEMSLGLCDFDPAARLTKALKPIPKKRLRFYRQYTSPYRYDA